jgi:DNA modification methylase
MSGNDKNHPAVEAWRQAPRRWGDPLHSLCSYMAMFPPAMPHVFIKWLTQPGDTVYDPFSGRGTTAVEACLQGRRGLGSDFNPLAVVLTSAKVDPPTWEEINERLGTLRRKVRGLSVAREDKKIRSIFSDHTLGQLLWLRKHLDRENRTDKFLLATLSGILHLNANSVGTPRGLTVSMPNTFAMAPGYVMKFIEEHDLVAPDVDVICALDKRTKQLRSSLELPVRGEGWSQDALAEPSDRFRDKRAKLVFTSPPYLHVIKYGKFNWIRLWLLGENPKEVDSALLSTSSLKHYLEFMSCVLRRLAQCISDDGYACLVIGDVRKDDVNIRLAEHVARECVPGSGLHEIAILVDELPSEQKVSRIWGATRGRATKTDRILVLGGPDARDLPELPSFDWTSLPSKPHSDVDSLKSKVMQRNLASYPSGLVIGILE